MKNSSLARRLTTDRLALADWLRVKPYGISNSPYDREYLSVCQDVDDILKSSKNIWTANGINAEMRGFIAVAIGSYFEDYVSEIGLWRVFIEQNHAVHGYYLPFFNLENYDVDNINVQDIHYLIWHFAMKYAKDSFISPVHTDIEDMAKRIFARLDKRADDASATDFYDQYFTITEGYDFFNLKTKLDWFATKSYLFGADLMPKMIAETFEILNKGGIPKERHQLAHYVISEKYKFEKRSSFAALNAPEWFSRIARASDETKASLENLQYKHQGSFLFNGDFDATHYSFTAHQTLREYAVLKKSIQKEIQDSHAGKTTLNLSLVNWQGEWSFTGVMFGEPMSAQEIADLKKKPLSNMWMLGDEKLTELREMTDRNHESFVTFFGSELALFDNEKK